MLFVMFQNIVAPHLTALLEMFDRVCHLVVTEVLLPDTVAERARIVSKCISVSYRLIIISL